MENWPENKLERHGKRTYWKLLLHGTLSVSKVLLTNLNDLKRLRQPQASEERYTRPPRRYDIPVYDEGMTYCRSEERYLRPTRYCNSRAPEVIALAHSLGAYQKSDHEFAKAAFEFAKEKMTLEIHPIVSVEETLERGAGTCFQLISVFIALCRAAGIPARYKIFPTQMIQTWLESTINVDPLLKKWYESLGYFLLEGEGEALVDSGNGPQWQVAHVGPTTERQAAGGIPITRFGEDSLGVWFHAQQGTIMRLEALPRGLAGGSRLLHKISPGSMERVNVSVQKQIQEGRKIIQEAGGVRAYDAQAR
ncbi:MAG: hypothetical protein MAG431_02341 [Chloroflexi bacterium]|nr:hypothetical protein [Chloroflexota bacterium]